VVISSSILPAVTSERDTTGVWSVFTVSSSGACPPRPCRALHALAGADASPHGLAQEPAVVVGILLERCVGGHAAARAFGPSAPSPAARAIWRPRAASSSRGELAVAVADPVEFLPACEEGLGQGLRGLGGELAPPEGRFERLGGPPDRPVHRTRVARPAREARHPLEPPAQRLSSPGALGGVGGAFERARLIGHLEQLPPEPVRLARSEILPPFS